MFKPWPYSSWENFLLSGVDLLSLWYNLILYLSTGTSVSVGTSIILHSNVHAVSTYLPIAVFKISEPRIIYTYNSRGQSYRLVTGLMDWLEVVQYDKTSASLHTPQFRKIVYLQIPKVGWYTYYSCYPNT